MHNIEHVCPDVLGDPALVNVQSANVLLQLSLVQRQAQEWLLEGLFVMNRDLSQLVIRPP